jgi:hypothetical protein
VAVAAHDRHARLGEALLGADHVDDALAGVAHRVAGDAELLAVAQEDVHLLLGDGVGDGQRQVAGGDVVVHRRHRQVGAPHLASRQAQPVEGLRRGDLVDQVEVDVEEVGLVAAAGDVDQVAVPDLLAEGAGLRHRRHFFLCSAAVGGGGR